MRLRSADIEAARSDQFLRPTPWTRNAEANLRMCMFELDHMYDRPIELVTKSRVAIFPRFATNLSSKRLWIPRGFARRSVERRAALIGHELVHFRQRRHYGDRKFNRLYLRTWNPVWRWRFEVAAYREGMRIVKAQGASPAALHREASRVVSSLRRNYFINLRRSSKIDRITREVLESEI